MSKTNKKLYIISFVFLFLFLVLLFLILKIDVNSIGEDGTKIGLSTLNNAIFNYFGVNMFFYTLTDWLGLSAFIICGIFGTMGIIQLIKRKSILKVDFDIIILGVLYFVLLGVYIFFQIIIVNYRPIIMPNCIYPEASFPSSHTLATGTVCSTAIIEFNRHIKNIKLKKTLNLICVLIIFVTFIGRLISGVHWFTDILASIFLCCFFTTIFLAITHK